MGWTWEYIDTHMTVPRLLALADYWGTSPPLHEAFAAAFLGGTGPTSSTAVPAPELTSADDCPAFLRDFAGAGGIVAIPGITT